MPALSRVDKKNFETLQRAFANDDVCLADCRDKATGKSVPTLCAVSRDEEGQIILAPLGFLITGNPYEQLDPPGYDTPDTPDA